MSKSIRVHAPNCIVHLGARTQARQHWFTDDVKPVIDQEIVDAARATGMLLLARVVMKNHFHIVIRQGSQPLSHMMHRVMHRCARLLKRRHAIEDHVFGGRYWSELCPNPVRIRRTIVYAHLNPCRARLCSHPSDYRWSSHLSYVNARSATNVDNAVRDGLRFFARTASDDGVDQYLQHVRYQLSVDRYIRGEITAQDVPAPPDCLAGDAHWDQSCRAALEMAVRIKPALPIYDVACRLLEQLDPLCSLDVLRTGIKAPKLVQLRRDLVAALHYAGYRGTQIGRLLGLSTSAVSKICVSLTT